MSERTALPENALFYLSAVAVSSYNFFGEEEIRYIMDKKLAFAISSSGAVPLAQAPVGGECVIEPELIIKVYEEKYEQRNYYLLMVRIRKNGGSLCEFTYEYNGAASIFDGRVQNAMIDKFLEDLVKYLKM